MKISSATAEIEAPVPLKVDARQHSRYKINRWCTTGAVKWNSKLNTTTTNKASSSKTKKKPQNSRKQSGMLKVQGKPH